MDDVDKPSLMRKISGSGLKGAPVPTLDGVLHPEPVASEIHQSARVDGDKRSAKRVVLSRDISALSRSLKEEQNRKSSSASSRPFKANSLID